MAEQVRVRIATARDAGQLARLHAEIFPADAWSADWFASQAQLAEKNF